MIPGNAMTVDVEEHFQVQLLADYLPATTWDAQPSRVEANVARILAIFADHGVTATFFVLGWIGERHPSMIRAIVAAGHELASHGYRHQRADRQSPVEFLADVTRTKAILEDLAGCPVIGYRAASYSIGADNLWALRQLRLAGYRYSSSIFPIRHDIYGMADAPRFPFRHHPDAVVEIPIPTLVWAGRRFPCGGGGWFRLFPYPIFRGMLRRFNHEGTGLFYCHPWEIDPEQPRPEGLPWRIRWRHYLNLRKMEGRLGRLCQDFAWDRMDRVFHDAIHEAEF